MLEKCFYCKGNKYKCSDYFNIIDEGEYYNYCIYKKIVNEEFNNDVNIYYKHKSELEKIIDIDEWSD